MWTLSYSLFAKFSKNCSEPQKQVFGKVEASVECVGRKIRYGQHLPERGASPSWLPASTVAQGCQGRRRRGKAGALTGLWHGAIFSPFLCTTPNAWKPLLWLIFSKSATHTFYRRAAKSFPNPRPPFPSKLKPNHVCFTSENKYHDDNIPLGGVS